MGGLPTRDNEYECGASKIADGVLGAGMVQWEKMAQTNRHLILLDCSGGRLVGRVPQATVEQMLDPMKAEQRKYDEIWTRQAGAYAGNSPEVELLTKRLPREHAPRGRCLVVGAGAGKGFHILLARNVDVYACDISGASSKFYADVPTRFCRCPAEKLNYRASRFDCVVSADVLEHLPPENVPTALCEMARVLRPGGTAVLQVRCTPSTFQRNLHLCVREPAWWMETFVKMGKIIWSATPGADVCVVVEIDHADAK